MLLLGGCTSLPSGVKPVNDFELNRYLGTWYEIARLDHSFERGLSRVSANYTLLDDGTIGVINRGYLQEEDKWKEATGRARFVGSTDTGHLKVSFFGPFYSSYVIMDLDHQQYQYALVSGPTTDYLWILSRTRTLEPDTIRELVEKAASKGFAVENLIYVRHQ
jgi:apolipoprotein D and lipocalin family protein